MAANKTKPSKPTQNMLLKMSIHMHIYIYNIYIYMCMYMCIYTPPNRLEKDTLNIYSPRWFGPGWAKSAATASDSQASKPATSAAWDLSVPTSLLDLHPWLETHILWMDEILHHFETMGNHNLLAFTGESSFQGFLGGAGFCASTVCLLFVLCGGPLRYCWW